MIEPAWPPAYRLGPADAAIFETYVVPAYLSLFGEIALETIVESDQAQLIHVGCRTGYPDRGIAMKLPGSHIYGVDPSTHALELARTKAKTMRDMTGVYRESTEFPLPFPEGGFSHALSLHPLVTKRAALFDEMKRLLAPHGQIVVALPMRGSFVEVADLLREYALKYDDAAITAAVERALSLRPNVETLTEELETLGFSYVDVTLRPSHLSFENGRDFLEHPVTRLMLLPEFKMNLGVADLEKPMLYVRDAIDKYFRGSTFELSINVGCAAARRM